MMVVLVYDSREVDVIERPGLELKSQGGRLLANLISILERNKTMRKGAFFELGMVHSAITALSLFRVKLKNGRWAYRGFLAAMDRKHSLFSVVKILNYVALP